MLWNDDAVSYLEDMKIFWNSYKPFYDNEKFPALTFPLMKLKKEYYYNLLPERYLNHVVWCEEPKYEKEKYIPCGECHPCRRYKETIPEIFDRFIILGEKKSLLKKCLGLRDDKRKAMANPPVKTYLVKEK